MKLIRCVARLLASGMSTLANIVMRLTRGGEGERVEDRIFEIGYHFKRMPTKTSKIQSNLRNVG